MSRKWPESVEEKSGIRIGDGCLSITNDTAVLTCRQRYFYIAFAIAIVGSAVEPTASPCSLGGTIVGLCCCSAASSVYSITKHSHFLYVLHRHHVRGAFRRTSVFGPTPMADHNLPFSVSDTSDPSTASTQHRITPPILII